MNGAANIPAMPSAWMKKMKATLPHTTSVLSPNGPGLLFLSMIFNSFGSMLESSACVSSVFNDIFTDCSGIQEGTICSPAAD